MQKIEKKPNTNAHIHPFYIKILLAILTMDIKIICMLGKKGLSELSWRRREMHLQNASSSGGGGFS